MAGVCLLDHVRRACVIGPFGGSTPGGMRYPDGGGLTATGRARRESVRLQAVQMFEHDVSGAQVAHRLRVSTKSAYQWRRRWRAGGKAALASKGPGGAVCRLSGAQLGRLRAALHRLGYAPQVPIHRAAERDEQAIAAWRTTTWVKLRG